MTEPAIAYSFPRTASALCDIIDTTGVNFNLSDIMNPLRKGDELFLIEDYLLIQPNSPFDIRRTWAYEAFDERLKALLDPVKVRNNGTARVKAVFGLLSPVPHLMETAAAHRLLYPYWTSKSGPSLTILRNFQVHRICPTITGTCAW